MLKFRTSLVTFGAIIFIEILGNEEGRIKVKFSRQFYKHKLLNFGQIFRKILSKFLHSNRKYFNTCCGLPAVHWATPFETSAMCFPANTKQSWISLIFGCMTIFGIFKIAFNWNKGTPPMTEKKFSKYRASGLHLSFPRQ